MPWGTLSGVEKSGEDEVVVVSAEEVVVSAEDGVVWASVSEVVVSGEGETDAAVVVDAFVLTDERFVISELLSLQEQRVSARPSRPASRCFFIFIIRISPLF